MNTNRPNAYPSKLSDSLTAKLLTRLMKMPMQACIFIASVLSFEGTNLYGLVAQLVRAPPCHGGGRGFDPHPGRYRISQYSVFYNFGILAQLGEHLPYKQRVTGSSPVGPTFVDMA